MRDYRGRRAIAVPATTAPNSAPLTTALARLLGFSLTTGDVTNSANTGSQAAPAAGTAIASLTAVPVGEYTVEWSVGVAGALAAADIDNFGLYVGAAQVAVSLNPAVAGEYPQQPITVKVPAGGATVAIKAIGAATAGTTYTATETIASGAIGQGALMSATATLAVFGIQPGTAETEDFGDEGIYVNQDITLQVNSGTVSGCIYVRFPNDDKDGGEWRPMKGGNSPSPYRPEP